jgi:hypothetical protein
VLPSGFATDHGCAALRRHVLDRSSIDTCVSVENRDGLFPIHRSLKFLLLCATAGPPTVAIPYRSGVRSPDVLDQLADTGVDGAAVLLPRVLLERVSGDQLAIPDVRTARDLSLVSRLTYAIPAAGDADGWNAHFGRELNASDDKQHFVPTSARTYPVLEGKQLQPFTIDIAASRYHLPAAVAPRLLDPARTYGRPRLAYRDVASSTNRLTLIAAIVPAGVVTTHTLFCLKEDMDAGVQHFLCGVFNSYVANYLVRLRVSTHVTVAIVDRLPVPRPPRDSAAFVEIERLSADMITSGPGPGTASRLQAAVARLYGLTASEFDHVLSTFPLVPEDERRRAAQAFADVSR